MIEITAIGMGLVMTGVAVAVGGLMLEATLLMLCRGTRVPALIASLQPARSVERRCASYVESALDNRPKAKNEIDMQMLFEGDMKMKLRITKVILTTAAGIMFAR